MPDNNREVISLKADLVSSGGLYNLGEKVNTENNNEDPRQWNYVYAKEIKGYTTIGVNENDLENVTLGEGTTFEGKNNTGLGVCAHVEGSLNEVHGDYSHAEGISNKADGDHSHAEGQETIASGIASHAEGFRSLAQGNFAHAEGNSKAIGPNSHAENSGNAQGDSSHAEGSSTYAKGKNSHAEGYLTEARSEGAHAAGNETLASGKYSHSEGYLTTASGDYSHSEGERTFATGNNSHSEGEKTYAEALNSHTEGYSTTAEGMSSHAEGSQVKYFSGAKIINAERVNGSNNQYRAILDIKYPALEDGDIIELLSNEQEETTKIGSAISTEDLDESIIYDTDYNDFYFQVSEVSHSGGDNGTTSFCITSNKDRVNFPYIEGSHTWRNINILKKTRTKENAFGAHAEGGGTMANGQVSHTEGLFTYTNNLATHAEGYATSAITFGAHSEGVKTVAEGLMSHAEGCSTVANRMYQHAAGVANKLDSEGTNGEEKGQFLEIIGNGIVNKQNGSIIRRANARTLDWNGSQWNAGSITIGPRNSANYSHTHGSNYLIFEYDQHRMQDPTERADTTTSSKPQRNLGSCNGGDPSNLGDWRLWSVYGSNSSKFYIGYRKPGATSVSNLIYFGEDNKLYCKGTKTSGNDYAEYRKCVENVTPGRVVVENGDGTLSLATRRLQRGCEIVSDTFGASLCPSEDCTLPIAVAGRVLAYTDKDKNSFKIGACVCSGENGTVSMMTEEEERMYPGQILGIVSEIPNYEIWRNQDEEIQVDNRIWIKIK